MLTTVAKTEYLRAKWKNIAINDGIVRYNFRSREVPGLMEKSVQVGKRPCESWSSFITVTLEAVTAVFRAARGPADINAICRDYHEHCKLTANPAAVSGDDFNTPFDQGLF